MQRNTVLLHSHPAPARTIDGTNATLERERSQDQRAQEQNTDQPQAYDATWQEERPTQREPKTNANAQLCWVGHGEN